MKKLFLYIVLISYTALLCKPVMPYVSDFAGHVFFYARHMATVHAENGKWHVHFETAQNTKSDTEKEQNLPSSSKKDTADAGYCLFLTGNEKLQPSAAQLLQWPRENHAPVHQDQKKNYPPPRC